MLLEVQLAIRLEMHRLEVHFTANDKSASNETAPQRDVRETQWYGATREGLRNGIRFLKELREDVSQNGPLHLESWKDQIIKAFGVGFYDAFTEWKPMSLQAMYLAEFLPHHAETCKRPLPAISRPLEGVEIIADPRTEAADADQTR